MRPRTIARRKELANRAKAYIQENLANRLTLDRVAEELGVSASFLSRTFIDEVGMSFSKFVVEVRMLKAATILKNSPMLLVKQVACIVGVANSDYFARAYSSFFKRTPTGVKRSSAKSARSIKRNKTKRVA